MAPVEAGATPHGLQLGESRLAERHTAGESSARSAVISAILGILPRASAEYHTAPTAAAFAKNGLRDSHMIARLKGAERDAGGRRDTGLFRSVGIPFGKLPALKRMSPVEADIDAGFLANCSTVRCERSADTLRTLIADEAPRGFTRLVSAVNAGVNRLVRYRPDRAIYGQLDFWANPSTTLNRGAGDCEDYAILKMAVLARAGVPRSAMSVVVLRDQRREVYHAVLSIRTTQGNFILDNVRQQVLSDAALPDYVPLYSVSDGRGHIYGRPVGGSNLVASLAGLDGVAPGEGQEGSGVPFSLEMLPDEYGSASPR